MARGSRIGTGNDMEIVFLKRKERHSAAGSRPDYAHSPDFKMPWWSQEDFGADQSFAWFSLLVGSNEVARVMLEPLEKFGGYFNIDTTGPFMEVVFLEVATSQQRRGIGTLVVDSLERRFPVTPLAAISQDTPSDHFWSAVNWRRYEHSALPDMRRIYISNTIRLV
jgi:ribosomal protein S18 acetylase RimI-like enzyme